MTGARVDSAAWSVAGGGAAQDHKSEPHDNGGGVSRDTPFKRCALPRLVTHPAIVFPSSQQSITKGNTTMELTNRILSLVAFVAIAAVLMTGLIVIIASFDPTPIRLAAAAIVA
jgi:hypothetical protein